MPHHLSSCDRAVLDSVIRNTNGYNYATCKLSFKDIADITSFQRRNVITSVKRLCVIGILCTLEKNTKISINEYYIDPYWNTDESIKKQLENIQKEKPSPKLSPGPCLIEDKEIDMESQSELEIEIIENPTPGEYPAAEDDKIETENVIEIYTVKINSDRDQSDSEKNQDSIEIETKAFVKSLISNMPDDSTRHACSDQQGTCALNDHDPGTSFKKQTYTREQIKNVCKKFNLAFPDDRLDDYNPDDYKFIAILLKKYGFDLCMTELKLLGEYRKHTKILNARGIFVSSLAYNYIEPLRLRQKIDADRYWQRKADESHKQHADMMKTHQEIEARRNNADDAKSKLSDSQLAELRKRAYDQLIAEGQPAAFIQFALESRINELINL
jgi:hypothetical protein